MDGLFTFYFCFSAVQKWHTSGMTKEKSRTSDPLCERICPSISQTAKVVFLYACWMPAGLIEQAKGKLSMQSDNTIGVSVGPGNGWL